MRHLVRLAVLLPALAFGQRPSGNTVPMGNGLPPIAPIPPLGSLAPVAPPSFPRGVNPGARFAPFYGGYGGYGYAGYAPYAPAYPPVQNIVVIQQPQAPPAPEPPPVLAKPVIVEYKGSESTVAPSTAEVTLFAIVLKNGSTISALASTTEKDGLHLIDADGGHRHVPADSIDREATNRVNRERNLRLQLPPPR